MLYSKKQHDVEYSHGEGEEDRNRRPHAVDAAPIEEVEGQRSRHFIERRSDS